MADEKVFADGYVDAIIIRQNQLTDPSAPSATEINTYGINISNAIAWDGTTWPTNTDSNDTDDRSIKDAGNAKSRGYSQVEGAFNLFRPLDDTDTVTDYGKVFQFLKDAADRIPVYVITRILQTTKGEITPVAEGDIVSVFKMITDASADDTEGDDSVKYSTTLLPQGASWPYTQVVGASKNAIVATSPGGATLTVGQSKAMRATLNGKRMTNQVTWASSNPAVLTVSNNGVITGVSAGTASVTATHPAGTVSTGVSITVS